MNKLKNIWLVFSGLILLLTAVLISSSSDGASIVAVIVSFYVLIYAMKQFVLYFTTARYMVGGKSIMFKGLIALDFAILLFSINDFKSVYIMIYLIILYFASGVIDIYRALEMKKLGGRMWKPKAAYGMFNVVISILCIFFIRSYRLMCFIFGLGLVLSAFRRIGKAFRKTEMVYIQ